MKKKRFPVVTVKWRDAMRVSEWATISEHIEDAKEEDMLVVSKDVLLVADEPTYVLIMQQTLSGDQMLQGVQIPRECVVSITGRGRKNQESPSKTDSPAA